MAAKNMRAIINELKNLFAELRRWQTWLGIGLISLFALLAYLVGTYAFKSDTILMFLRHTAGSCREMTNNIIIFLFCGMIFFLFTALLTLGEVQQYLTLKQRSAHYLARKSLHWAIVWGVVAVGIAVAALIFFKSYCL